MKFNNLVAKVQKGDQEPFWTHRSHCRILEKRLERLTVPPPPPEPDPVVPFIPTRTLTESGGPVSAIQNARASDSIPSKIPRPKRNPKAVDRLGIIPNYGNLATLEDSDEEIISSCLPPLKPNHYCSFTKKEIKIMKTEAPEYETKPEI